jgi:hypothetical protein
MSVMMKGYNASTAAKAVREMRQLHSHERVCPMCKRVAKWYYNYYQPTSKLDTPFRCTLHEINPIPGPTSEPDQYKVDQLY